MSSTFGADFGRPRSSRTPSMCRSVPSRRSTVATMVRTSARSRSGSTPISLRSNRSSSGRFCRSTPDTISTATRRAARPGEGGGGGEADGLRSGMGLSCPGFAPFDNAGAPRDLTVGHERTFNGAWLPPIKPSRRSKKLSPAAERALAEAAARRARAERKAAEPAQGSRRAQRSRANPLWRLGKEGFDVRFLMQFWCHRIDASNARRFVGVAQRRRGPPCVPLGTTAAGARKAPCRLD